MEEPNPKLLQLRKKANGIVFGYASIAAAIAFICAVDPEPLSGTLLEIFADTPLLTVVTFSMMVHLCLFYGDRDILRDGLLIIAGLSAGTVVGALGVRILARLIPIAGTVNNAIVTFALHYATGHVVIDFLEKGKSIRDLTLEELKRDSKKYEEEGKARGKKVVEVRLHGLTPEEKAELNQLDKSAKEITSQLHQELEKETPNQEVIEKLQKELEDVTQKSNAIYEKHGINPEE